MDPTTWRPHGLIVHPGMEAMYLGAQVTVDPNGRIVDPKEHKTIALFNFLFSRSIFPGFSYDVSPEQPPAISSQNKCDIVIKYLTVDYAWQVLCFVEGKRARNQTDSLINAVEKQASEYCQEFLEANNVDMVYACTIVGASIRCWTVEKDEPNAVTMTGFWDGSEQGKFQYYLDIGLEQNKDRLLAAFERMKAFPIRHLPLNMDHSSIGTTRRR